MTHDELFQVLADPTRRRIVEALQGGERTVGAIVDAVDIQQSGVSRHLRILHDAGFVRVRRQGAQRVYALRPEPFEAFDAWVRQYRSLWEGRLDRFGAALDRKREAREGARDDEERR